MLKHIRKMLVTGLASLCVFTILTAPSVEARQITKVQTAGMREIVEEIPLQEDLQQIVEFVEANRPEPALEETFDISREEIELIALATMAEAEGECEEGKRLVIDTILNRADSGYFPDTIHGVVYQKNQFTSMWNGRADRCYVKEDIVQLVEEELVSRYNSDVVFFRTKRYSSYGEPMFQVGNHYFSSYN